MFHLFFGVGRSSAIAGISRFKRSRSSISARSISFAPGYGNSKTPLGSSFFAESVGFTFVSGGNKLCYMTDIGCFRESMFARAAGSDLVFIEANHDVEMLKNGPYPYPLKQRILSENGHLSNENCGKALARLYETGVRFAVLGHLSRENNTEYAAFSTVTSVLEEAGAFDMRLVVAKRDAVTGIFEI